MFMPNKSALVVLSLIALGGTARSADAPPPAENVGSAPAEVPAKHRKLVIGASFLPMAMGKYTLPSSLTDTTTQDAYFAYGAGVSVSYEVLPGLFVGFAPQVIFNVQAKPNDIAQVAARRQLDLLGRVAYARPLVDTVSVYAEVLPGWSDMMPLDDSNPSRGFVLAFGVGCTVDMTDRFFMNLGAGYQIGFQSEAEGVHTLALRTQYVRIALGGGVKF
jgi:hypothetical protein